MWDLFVSVPDDCLSFYCVAICWGKAVLLVFHLCCFYFSGVLIVCVPFQFGAQGRMWNSIVSVSDSCLFI